MNKKLSGVFTVILMINVLTFNIYAMEHLIDRNDREYSEILSLNDEISDSLNHGLVHSETGKDISEDVLKMEQAFKVYADIELNQAKRGSRRFRKQNINGRFLYIQISIQSWLILQK